MADPRGVIVTDLNGTPVLVASKSHELMADRASPDAHPIGAITGLADALAGLSGDVAQETAARIAAVAAAIAQANAHADDLLASAMTFKGVVETEGDLPVAGQKLGDFWIITEDGSERIWSEDGWETLGTFLTVDLSGYATVAALTTGLAGKVDAADVAVNGFPNTIVRRNGDGGIVIGEGVSDNEAVTLGQLTEHDYDISQNLAGKLDKVTSAGTARAYGVTGTGAQEMLPVAATPDAGSLAKRTPAGQVAVGSATDNTHAVPRGQLDTILAELGPVGTPVEVVSALPVPTVPGTVYIVTGP